VPIVVITIGCMQIHSVPSVSGYTFRVTTYYSFFSSFIVISWYLTGREQIPLLIGKAADPAFINRLVRIAITHDERIRCLDTLIVYYFGSNFIVELHVVMDPTLVLQDAHDVAESLQIKLERLAFVERAFVHCDYKCDGDEHLNKRASG
jgi:divalent metal cation (Fe/Co/Zn/Cd) transporter